MLHEDFVAMANATLNHCFKNVTEKLSQARKMQTTVTSPLEEQPTVNLVNATRETVDQITQEIAEL